MAQVFRGEERTTKTFRESDLRKSRRVGDGYGMFAIFWAVLRSGVAILNACSTSSRLGLCSTTGCRECRHQPDRIGPEGPPTEQRAYHWIFANRSRFRKRLPPPPSIEDDQQMLPDEEGKFEVEDAMNDGQHDSPPSKRPRRLVWASLMRRVLDFDVLTCPKCAASMVVIPS